MLIAVELLFVILLAIVLFMIFKNEGIALKNKLHKARVEGCWNGENRRQHPRAEKSLGVVYTVVKNHAIKNAPGKTVNISQGGIKLLLDEKLPPKTSLSLKISISDSGETAEVTGDVVWTEDATDIKDPSGKRFFYSGIKFSSPKDPSGNNLTDYICSLSKSQES